MALHSLYPTSCQKKTPQTPQKPKTKQKKNELSVDLLTRSYLTLRWRQRNASPKFYLVCEETFTQNPLTERTSGNR